MHILNLPEYEFKYKAYDNLIFIFDKIRKKYILLTEEEYVRQHFVEFLIKEKKFPASLIKIEAGIKVNGLSKRGDIVLYNNKGKAIMIVECKSPSVNINQDVFDQIAIYNINLKVDYLITTNGIKHYCCKINHSDKTYQFLENIPEYKEIS
ncbi:MAG: type I restriction enzyme HsdR N-terminal domain-containing protein [Bacteroidota bacterium]|nr:type I restriction enzyme HsdR N-terminal domain-containing protein [Bacteroidota bacterium]